MSNIVQIPENLVKALWQNYCDETGTGLLSLSAILNNEMPKWYSDKGYIITNQTRRGPYFTDEKTLTLLTLKYL